MDVLLKGELLQLALETIIKVVIVKINLSFLLAHAHTTEAFLSCPPEWAEYWFMWRETLRRDANLLSVGWRALEEPMVEPRRQERCLLIPWHTWRSRVWCSGSELWWVVISGHGAVSQLSATSGQMTLSSVSWQQFAWRTNFVFLVSDDVSVDVCYDQ